MGLSLTPAESWLVHTAVGGGLLLLLALALMRLVRQPVRRQRLGEWGLVAALVVAVMAFGPAWLTLSWPAEEVAAPKAPELETLVMAVPMEGDVAAGPELAADVPAIPIASPEPVGESLFELLGPWLLWIFTAGAALFLGHWLLGYVILARILRNAKPVPASVARLFEGMRGYKPGVRLLVSKRLPVPVSCGIFRPTIVLPVALCEPPDVDKLRWVFAHELTHLDRRDSWSTVLFGVGQTIYFYLPWFWALRRQVRLCQEYVADAAAIQAVGGIDVPTETAAEYAEFLLSLTNSPAVPVVATGVSGNTSDLFRRVSMLLQNPLRIERRCSQIWSLLTGAVLLTAAIVLGGIGLQVDAAPADEVAVLAEEQKEVNVNVRRIMLTPAGENAQVKVIVLDHKDPTQGDIIIRKDGGDAKKIFIHKATVGDGKKYVLWAAQEGQLDPLRKALEKLEKSRSVDPAKIRAEVMKALEAINAAPAGEKASKHLIEIRLHIDPDNKKVHTIKVNPVPPTVPAPPIPPTPATAPRISPPPVAKPLTVQGTITLPAHALPAQIGGQKVERTVTATVQQVDADAIRKAVEKALKSVEKAGDADSLAKAIEKALQALPQTKTGQYTAPKTVLALPMGARVDIQAIKKLVEQLEKSPGDQKVLHELLKAIGPQGGQMSMPMMGEAYKYVLQPPPATYSASPYQVAFSGGSSGQGRLGISVESPSSLLADQLNLPMGQGLVITDVKADSPAAKAGLKANDILMEINKKSVTNKATALIKLIEDVKAGAAIEAVVLRKGKRETISGITLPERPATGSSSSTSSPPVRATAVQALSALGGTLSKPGSTSVSTTTIRNDDKFTTRYQEGSLIISVVGSVTGGKATVQDITIQDGSASALSFLLENVPAQYRDKVNYIIEISSKGEFRTESKK